MRAELNETTYVIAEAREAGNVGIIRGRRSERRIGPGDIDADTSGKNIVGSSAKGTAIIFY